VLALTIFAASPVAHGFLHGNDAAHGQTVTGDACAVVMFASGVALTIGPIAVAPSTTVSQRVSPITSADIFLLSPRYLRQPERGPPVI
jgi:hypothetical protein